MEVHFSIKLQFLFLTSHFILETFYSPFCKVILPGCHSFSQSYSRIVTLQTKYFPAKFELGALALPHFGKVAEVLNYTGNTLPPRHREHWSCCLSTIKKEIKSNFIGSGSKCFCKQIAIPLQRKLGKRSQINDYSPMITQ